MAKNKKSRKRTARKVPAVRVRRAGPAAKKATKQAAKKKAAPRKPPKATAYKNAPTITAASMTAPPAPGVLSFGAGLETIVKNSSLLSDRVAELTNEVSFSVATKTAGGKPIQQQLGLLTAGNLQEYNPVPDAQEDAIDKLVSEGCRLVRRGRFAVTMCGPASVVEKLIGGKLVVQARARRSPLRATQMFATSFEPPLAHDLFVSPAASLSVGTAASDNVDHLVFIPPPAYFAPPSPNAPPGSFHRVDEASIRSILNVPAGFDGDGVRVAMVDTGFFPHPYYSQRGLKFRAVPTASAPNPQVDDYGHGTAIAYNVFATAPKVELLGFQQTDPPQDALEDAADANVDVITCSWGWDREQLFPLVQASLLSIINEGKIVLFASGNGHYAWPGSEPDVISVGGVYSNSARGLEASDYASGFMSGMFPGRRTPDVCGLCGQRPKAIYIMMPTQPANTMDRENGGTTFPNGDETTASDGWVGASGTSSATPQIAGIVALMVQKARANGTVLTPVSVKAALEQSCVLVTAGRNAMGFPAVGQPNTAVGFGLVDATAALASI
jgi:serine protease AprX